LVARVRWSAARQEAAQGPRAAASPEISSLAFSPRLIMITPSSQPRITCPTPMVNLNGDPRSTEESNLVPLVRVPV